MEKTIEYRNVHGNRKYKDSLFRMVFQKKTDLLELYNAVNGTNYNNPDDLEINTLENVLYITMKNDTSFMIGCTINLYEHQSSYNPNMPFRGLIYFSQLYNKYAEQRKLNLFSTALQKIPTPQYIVFYNGLKSEPDCRILKLSDAFETDGGCLECEATMLNINYGRNLELMEKCKRLEEYAIFIAAVRNYTIGEKMSLNEAITQAIDECIEKGILVDVLTEQRAEVFMYILESFDKELYERDLRDNIRAEVKEEVRAEVKEEVKAEVKEELREEVKTECVREKLKSQIKIKLSRGKSVEEIADALEEAVETIQSLIKEI